MRSIILLYLVIFAIQLGAQCPAGLEDYATSFAKVDVEHFSFLDDNIQEAKIIGIGESTHGTAEYAQLVGSLFMNLVNEYGVRLLIIEDAFGAVRKMDQYISGSRPSPELSEGNWRYYTEEFSHLLELLKSYNHEHPNDLVHIYGPEMQYASDDAVYVKDYLVGKEIDMDFGRLTAFSTIWNSLKPGQLMDGLILLDKVSRILEQNRENWQVDAEYIFVVQHLKVIRQFLTARLQTTEQRKHDFREIFMLENIQWVLWQNGPKAKALFWAHNSHIGSGNVNNTNSIGHHLRRTFGDQYFSIGTEIGKGSFIAYPPDANVTGNWRRESFSFPPISVNSLTHCADVLGNPNVYLNLRAAAKDERLRSYLALPQTIMAGAGAQARAIDTVAFPVGKNFDALIYLDRSTPIKTLR